MKYPAIMHAFASTPWAILPEKYVEIKSFLMLKASGVDIPANEVKARVGDPGGVQRAGKVCVMQLFGTICQRMALLEDSSGGTSCESFGRVFDQMVADKSIKAIVLQIDSPGGSVFGVEDLAGRIYQARDEKKVIGLVDSTCASAAYWLGSQCTELNIVPGGMAGSIGVLLEHYDCSIAMAAEGVKCTLVTAGKYKGEGNPYEPLTDEGLAAMQKMVDGYYASFVAAVARGRGVTEAKVRNGFGQGRMLADREACAAGLCDRVRTMDQVLSSLGAPLVTGANAEAWAPSLEARRRRMELEEAD